MSSHKAIVIRTDCLIDGISDFPIKDGGILIENNKITRAVSWEEGTPWPDGERILQLKSKAVIPGLINIHVHITGEEDLNDYIESGITTVRDVGTIPFGDDNMLLTKIKDKIEKGNLKGPRIFSYGSIIDGPKPIFPTITSSISSVDEIINEIDRQIANGVDGIKLYSNITPRFAAAAIKRAKEHDKPVAGHIGILISGVEGGRLGNVQYSCDHPHLLEWIQIPAPERIRGYGRSPDRSIRCAKKPKLRRDAKAHYSAASLPCGS